MSTSVTRTGKRDLQNNFLSKRDVAKLLEMIRTDHRDTKVLKIKEHISSDISPLLLEHIIGALEENTTCQALYAQNLSSAFGDHQLRLLLGLLKKKCIWALNLGENYEISPAMWNEFTEALKETSVTHLYVSEHVINMKLKTRMRDAIRENRKKHNKHRSKRNISVIEKCTNLWWNPINSIKHRETRQTEALIRKRQRDGSDNPSYTIYWAEGEGSRDEWKFACRCGEVCSHYEKHIFHPTGLMYQCTMCGVWGHANCNFGAITESQLDSMQETYCQKCIGIRRRIKRTCIDFENNGCSVADIAPAQSEEDAVTVKEEWVQCDKCLKWRRLPPKSNVNYPRSLPDSWQCKMSTWSRKPSCTKRQEPYDDD